MSRTALYAGLGAVFVAIAAVTGAKGADLGKPVAAAPAAVVAAPVPDQWQGAFIEAGAGGAFAKGGNKELLGRIGAGYNFHAFGNPFVGGVFAYYGAKMEGHSDSAMLTFDEPLTVGARAGFLIQPSTYLYGTFGYSKSINGADFKGPVVGFGIEVPSIGNIKLGLEYQAQFAEKFKIDDETRHAVMLLARIPVGF